jgi:hypothetical protein
MREKMQNVPVDVVQLPAGGVAELSKQVPSGFCSRTSNGDVWCWGDQRDITGALIQDEVPLPLPGQMAPAIRLGGTCGVFSGGHVRCWGNDELGQLGDGTTSNSGIPVDVISLAF